VILICTNGSAEVSVDDNAYSINKGQTLLIPASIKNIELVSNQTTEITEVNL
jgi:mannose-6-phosphate isomerase class I